jgi:small-conductance mechanosensitive channel
VAVSAALTPSMRVLVTKLANIALLTVAGLVALGAIGIDLTALTVLTGALGLGVGFGLQKAVANFVSGLSMLLDRSIRPGDVISVGQTFGWVRTMGGRYVAVQTRDGLEYLIPNEDLITKEVVNWSNSDNQIRIRAPIGVSYKADIHKARQLCVEAACATNRVLKEPAPLCHLVGFGDSAVDLELRFWINDPRAGLANVKSDVLLKVWDKFKAEGIEIPYPQRDVHLPSRLRVEVAQAGESGA